MPYTFGIFPLKTFPLKTFQDSEWEYFHSQITSFEFQYKEDQPWYEGMHTLEDLFLNQKSDVDKYLTSKSKIAQHGWGCYIPNRLQDAILFRRRVTSETKSANANHQYVENCLPTTNQTHLRRNTNPPRNSPARKTSLTSSTCQAGTIEQAMRSPSPIKFTQPCDRIITDLFSIKRKIGQGQYGAVYMAEFEGKPVALKKFNVNEDAANELLNEIEVAAQLSHPNLMRYNVGFETPEGIYGVMEAVPDGITAFEVGKYGHLADPMKRLKATVKFAHDAFNGLAYMHELGLVHRDIKGDNVMIDQFNNRAVIIDYGWGCIDACTVSFDDIEFQYRLPFAENKQIQIMDVYAASDVYAMGLVVRDLLHTCFKGPTTTLQGIRHWQANEVMGLLSKDIYELLWEEVYTSIVEGLHMTGAVPPLLSDVANLIMEAMGLNRSILQMRKNSSIAGFPSAQQMRDKFQALASKYHILTDPNVDPDTPHEGQPLSRANKRKKIETAGDGSHVYPIPLQAAVRVVRPVKE
jgi:serine/threonine protein kinase